MQDRRLAARGFSLIELMIVIAILGIVLSLGVPMFRTFMQNQKIRATAESIYNGLQMARGEAIKNNGVTCFYPIEPSNGASWCVRPANDGAGCGGADEVSQYVSFHPGCRDHNRKPRSGGRLAGRLL